MTLSRVRRHAGDWCFAAAVALLAALTACTAEDFDPDPCDNPDGTCATVPNCGEVGCDGS